MGTSRLKTRSNSAFRLIYHLVLVTKFRKKSLSAEMLERIEEVVKDVLGKWDGELIEFGGETDHVHILFEAIPSIELSKLVNQGYFILNKPISVLRPKAERRCA